MQVAMVLLAVLLAAGCAASRQEGGGPPAPVGERGWLDEHDTWMAYGGGEELAETASGDVVASERRAAADGSDAVALTVPGGDPAAVVGGPEAPNEPPVDGVGLRAGSVDDNERWEEYLRYAERFEALGLPFRRIDVSGRHLVTVRDRDDRPVLAARVVVATEDGTVVADARSAADGRAVVFVPPAALRDQQSRAAAYTVTVTKGDATTVVPLDAAPAQVVGLDRQEAAGAPARLDVAFLVDATGSMGDEIERLKANMISVAEQIAALPARPDVRFALTVYRDRGDVFVTRTFDFTGDVPAFTAALREVVADNGGDTPEDLEAGLADVVRRPAWRVDDTVSLVFLVADAPPHLDYEDSTPYDAALAEARAKGIKVSAIASSGLDPQGEYVFRQMAQTTLGRFVFLTYGADGVSPGDQTTHHVDGYSVLPLDELVVKLVADELAARG
jgi:hypothetical protein